MTILRYTGEMTSRIPCTGRVRGIRYLDIEHIVDAAIATGCDAIHPGYGFLAENCRLCWCSGERRTNFRWSFSKPIMLFGNKVAARNWQARRVPPVPATAGSTQVADVKHS